MLNNNLNNEIEIRMRGEGKIQKDDAYDIAELT